jgi:trehalose 6-phosphate synthase/phosphatase
VHRILFLDYDGTLNPFATHVALATPKADLITLLRRLVSQGNTVVLNSGRDRTTMDRWFGQEPFELAAEHGAWIRHEGTPWEPLLVVDLSWKQTVLPLIVSVANRLRGSEIENKDFSISWHYRQADQTKVKQEFPVLKETLERMIEGKPLSLIYGNHVLEVIPQGISKGQAALRWVNQKHYDEIVAIGDDVTDETMFAELPPSTRSYKVGPGPTQARFRLDGVGAVRALLSCGDWS